MTKNLRFLKSYCTSRRATSLLVLAMLLISVPKSIAARDNTSLALIEQSLESRVTVKMSNATIESILVAICREAKLRYVTERDVVIETSKSHSINVSDAAAKDAIASLLRDTDYDFEINDRGVVIVERERPTAIAQSQQQSISVVGKIIDDKKNPIAGATVILKGTSEGAISDGDGAFIVNAKIGDELEVSSTGYVEQTIKITNSTITITLMADVLQVDDVVVTGVVNRRTSTYTGSVTTLKAEDLKRVSNSNVFESLKVLDPSLMILDNLEDGSNPNSQPDMLLRGTGSFESLGSDLTSVKGTYTSNPNSPLFILDGFETTVETIMDLDLERVASLTILKDATAKSLYGVRAANGVIVIETKVNSDGGARVTYSGNIDIEAPDLSSYNLMNAQEKLAWEVKMGVYDYMARSQEWYQQKLTNVARGVDTDWLAKPLQNAVSNSHRVGFEFGSEAIRVNAGFSYNKNNGTMIGSDRTTTSGDIKVTYRRDKFNVSNSTTYTHNVSNESPYGLFSEYVAMDSYYAPYDENGVPYKSMFEDPNGAGQPRVYIGNPIWDASLNNLNQQRYFQLVNNTYFDYWITDELKATGRLGITSKITKADEYYSPDDTRFGDYTEDRVWEKGSYQKNEGESFSMSGDVMLTYNKVINDHLFSASFKGALSQLEYDEYWINAVGFPSDMARDLIFSNQYAINGKPEGYAQITRTMSALITGNYSYKDKYLFDFTINRDGSSEYSESNRWGTFWSTGIGWNIHEEEFMKAKWVNRLKLRGSIGTTGAASTIQYGGMLVYNYIIDKLYNNMFGLEIANLPNYNLGWQEKLDRTIGVDATLFNNRLNLTADFYSSITQNSLISQTISPSHGFNTVDENVGKVRNTGVDLRLSYRAWEDVKNRSYLSIFVNASHNKNTILELSDAMKAYNEMVDEQFTEGREDARPLIKYEEGQSMDAIWAMQSAGIDPQTGSERFILSDGTITYDYIASEQQALGNSLPLVNGSAGLAFEYKGFGVNVALSYRFGGQMYNYTLANKVEAYDLRHNIDRRVLDGAWSEPGQIAKYAKHDNFKYWPETYVDGTGNVRDNNGTYYHMAPSGPTSRFIMDENRLDISSVNLSYDFWRHDFVKKLGIESMRLTLYANNVATLSNVLIERGTSYPFSRTFKANLSITF